MAAETVTKMTETIEIPPRSRRLHRHRQRNETERARNPPGKVPVKRTINFHLSDRLV